MKSLSFFLSLAIAMGAAALDVRAEARLLPSITPVQDDTSQVPAREEDYYDIVTLPIPEGVVFEVGGMALMPSGELAVSTRRGDVWLVENPYMQDHRRPFFKRFAQGLHEPLGLAYHDDALYATQRGELTRMIDADGDDRADRYETVVSWPLEGNYHEYSYGPLFMPNGNMLVTLNLAWVGRGASLSKWRGWALEITPEGKIEPMATGMRSPAGIGLDTEGELFYSENQGDWIGSGYITHVEKGDFVGNPGGLKWSGEPGSPLSLKPEDVPDTGEPLFEVAKSVDALKPPAVWFPHTLLGISTSGILTDTTTGAFGPFEGQLFVGDQGHSRINRVFLEKVKGVYQGAVFPFREGFESGVLRMVWGKDGSMFVGQTSRGWDATGKAPYGLQRLVWTGKMPFEVKEMRAMPDGFELVFTRPVDPEAAADPEAYEVTSFIYKYHHHYGSPPINQQQHAVQGVVVSDDGLRARVVLDEVREGYIHEVKMAGVRARSGGPLLHDVGYYTMNRVPEGERLAVEATVRKTGRSSASQQVNLTAGVETTGAKHVTEMPASWTGGPDVTISIATKPGLQYDLASFQVSPGSRVKIVFNNNDDMTHNVVFTRPGRVKDVVEAAMQMGLSGPDKHYVPDSEDVLYYTAILEPLESQAIYFTAPSAPGAYPYVCTYPGHSTMQGTMEVTGN